MGFQPLLVFNRSRIYRETGMSVEQVSKSQTVSPWISLEGMMLKLKLQYFGHLLRRAGKDSDAGRDWGPEEKGTTEDEMRWLDGWMTSPTRWT